MFFLIIAILLGVVGIGAGIFFFVRNAIDRSAETNHAWKYKQFTTGSKWILFLGVLVSLAGIPLTIIGVTNPDYWYLGFSWIVTLIVSIAMAYICSPLTLTILPVLDLTKGVVESEGGLAGGVSGCLTMFIYLPISIGIGIVSFTAITICSWVFALMAVFRGTKKWVKIISLILVGAILLSIPFSIFLKKIVTDKNHEKDYLSIQQALDAGSSQKLTFLEEDIDYFEKPKTKRMVAEKLSELYRNRDIDGVYKVFDFASVNYPDLFLNKKEESLGTGNIFLTEEFFSFLKNDIMTNGTQHNLAKYTYRGYTIHFIGTYNYFSMNSGSTWFYVASEKRANVYPADYFLTGETVELKLKKGGLRE